MSMGYISQENLKIIPGDTSRNMGAIVINLEHIMRVMVRNI